ncbi:hypothetical protein GCM10011416_04680 [Polaribacter pacificus]|uniref:Carbohydrate-binding domain-containing protein n=2 Tax=Polaribacter pacificus TaxID=1775173 RepID=A0A917HVS4_9FLAO|nr:hypothetical protein GCM10011416_04680 [Polaribacter pacificus]
MIIDGKAEEESWKTALFTDEFIDIEGIKTPSQKTQVKMLWDEDYLYVYAKLYEAHIWGDITKRDAVIYYNNDFEVFIDPSNTTHNYGEIEINALGTVWDLNLNKPYYLGGKAKNSWHLENLKSAIYIDGTINNPDDLDNFWSVEIAIPLANIYELKAGRKGVPKNEEQWRINFSRVQWDYDLKNKRYSRKKEAGKFLPEYNWVWSNQGAINMHLPENWGYLQFSDQTASKKIKFKQQTDHLSEQLSYALFREIAFKSLQNLKTVKPGTAINFATIIYKDCQLEASFLKTYAGFTIKTTNTKTGTSYIIKEDGALLRKTS